MLILQLILTKILFTYLFFYAYLKLAMESQRGCLLPKVPQDDSEVDWLFIHPPLLQSGSRVQEAGVLLHWKLRGGTCCKKRGWGFALSPQAEGRRPEPLMGSHQGDSVGGSVAQRPSGLPWNLMTNRQDPFVEKPRSGRQN